MVAIDMTQPTIRFLTLILTLVIGQFGRRKKRIRRKSQSIYSKSEKNAIIDSVVHPLADEHWSFVIVDGVLHAFNEEDPIQSLFKFLKYNGPELLKRILKEKR